MTNDNFGNSNDAVSKVPAVTFGFCVVKVLATTFGETGGDWMSSGGGQHIRPEHHRHRSPARRSAVLLDKGLAHDSFWAAFILTKPLGATLGDLRDKPTARGGLNFSRQIASLILLACITAGVMFIPQRAARAGDGA